MSKWLHSLASIGLAAVAIALPQAQQAVSTHPAVAASLATAWAIIGHLLPSPVAQLKEN